VRRDRNRVEALVEDLELTSAGAAHNMEHPRHRANQDFLAIRHLRLPSVRSAISQHVRQIGANRAARIALIARKLARAVGCELIGPGEQLCIAPVPRDQVGEPVSTGAPAFGAFDPQLAKLADQVPEDDRAVAGTA
jgi:hypothetical protein